mmetsp:Transcript_34953/g.33995  ORF Transcript_34953/g.33995 Transcript_34953/m.33995 type:complete len:238 (-) Transcript_34953:158-871(-)|eukprot:CAMPEP_0170544958 /NCGR_PEP_ID=MMETSP0211-20121228/3523_1 /TAXON_ID=311385 /ORGANISM="Pseudokeronopsis sp., Strain OXSARD2" /LENGTH=237 /DNA_ID=CAMNT_0010848735 /DNA_START=164 /DNA_END=877 /DNA_ORIENTATION=+
MKLFGKISKNPKFESSYRMMVQQSQEAEEKQLQVHEDAVKQRESLTIIPQQKLQQELYGNVGNKSNRESGSYIPHTAQWDTFKSSSVGARDQDLQGNNFAISHHRKQQNLTTTLHEIKEAPVKKQMVTVEAGYKKAPYGTKADWRNVETNNKTYNNLTNARVDTFKERQKQLSSNIFDTKDYSMHQPLTKRFIDMDNYYEQKRVNDPLYSDLFNQCINTGGNKQSPIKKKGNEIGSA